MIDFVDYKNRVIRVGDKVKIINNIPTSDGMLYENSIVKVNEIIDTKMRVTDSIGKIWFVNPSDVSISFL